MSWRFYGQRTIVWIISCSLKRFADQSLWHQSLYLVSRNHAGIKVIITITGYLKLQRNHQLVGWKTDIYWKCISQRSKIQKLKTIALRRWIQDYCRREQSRNTSDCRNVQKNRQRCTSLCKYQIRFLDELFVVSLSNGIQSVKQYRKKVFSSYKATLLFPKFIANYRLS